MGTVPIRVWKDLYDVYKEVSDKAKIILSDFISLILLYAGVKEWLLISYVLQKEFDLKYEEAYEYATFIRDNLRKVMKEYIGDESA